MKNLSEQLQTINQLIDEEKIFDALKILVEVANIPPPPVILNQNLQMLYIIFLKCKDKTGLEFNYIIDCLLRLFYQSLQSDFVSVPIILTTIEVFQESSNNSTLPTVKNFLNDVLYKSLETFLQKNDWDLSRQIVAKSKSIDCYDDKMDSLCSAYQTEIQKFIENITSDPNYFYIFCPGSIGDIIQSVAFTYELQRRAGKSKTCLVISEKYASIGRMYDNIGRIISMPPTNFECIIFFATTKQIQMKDNWAIGSLLRDPVIDTWKIFQCDLYGQYKHRFNLPMDLQPAPFIMDKLPAESINQYGIDDRSIILFPKAISITINICTDEFWKSLAERLKSLGYKIFTNCGPNELPIDGTIPLQVNLQEIYWISERVKYCIGVRSGVFDLIALADSKIISCINDYQPVNDMITLEKYFKRPGLKTIIVNQSITANDLQNEIVSLVQRGNF